MRLVILRDYEEQFGQSRDRVAKCHRDRAVRKPRSQQKHFSKRLVRRERDKTWIGTLTDSTFPGVLTKRWVRREWPGNTCREAGLMEQGPQGPTQQPWGPSPGGERVLEHLGTGSGTSPWTACPAPTEAISLPVMMGEMPSSFSAISKAGYSSPHSAHPKSQNLYEEQDEEDMSRPRLTEPQTRKHCIVGVLI